MVWILASQIGSESSLVAGQGLIGEDRVKSGRDPRHGKPLDLSVRRIPAGVRPAFNSWLAFHPLENPNAPPDPPRERSAPMSSQLVDIFLLSLTAMFNPSLLAAVTVMLLLPNPKRLLVGYLLGAYLTSITLGLVIVFAVPGSSTESTSKHTISPLEDIVVGVLLWAVALVLLTGRDQPFQARRQEKKDAKLKARQEAGKPTESLPLRMLGKGDPRVTFVVGILLTFPGVSYLDALDHIRKLNPGTLATILLVLYFCVMQLLLLEVPLIGYVFSPDRTQSTITRFRNWMGRRGRTAAVIAATLLGLWLLARGVIAIA
jgi:Sap, sulfolipid-1-addressing protein